MGHRYIALIFWQALGFKHNLEASIQGDTMLPGLIIIFAGSPLLSADFIFLADGRGPATIYLLMGRPGFEPHFIIRGPALPFMTS